MRGTKEESHYAAVGAFVSNWAAFDAMVTSAIWQIGEIEDAIGACLTSQIYTLDGKFKALVSVLQVRGNLEKVISKVNKFHDEVRALSQYRNRLIHDPILFKVDKAAPQRLQISADKKLVMGYTDEPTENVLAQAKKVVDAIEKFEAIIRPALDRFPPLPLKD
jgi:hypothetical protein